MFRAELYWKYDSIVRGLCFLDAIIRCIECFMPLAFAQARAFETVFLVIDIFTNYCGDFFSNLVLINVQATVMTIISCYIE